MNLCFVSTLSHSEYTLYGSGEYLKQGTNGKRNAKGHDLKITLYLLHSKTFNPWRENRR